MPVETLGPFAQQPPHRPLAVSSAAPSLLECGRLQHRASEVPEPQRAAARRVSFLYESFVPSPSVLLVEESMLGSRSLASEIDVRAFRAASMVFAAECVTVPAQKDPSPSEPDVRPFVLAVRKLIEDQRVPEARQMLAVAPAHILGNPLVSRLRSTLAPPVVRRVPKHDEDRSLEYAWLRANGPEYRGRWVALVGGTLIATAPTLRELQQQIRGMRRSYPPLLHRVG